MLSYSIINFPPLSKNREWQWPLWYLFRMYVALCGPRLRNATQSLLCSSQKSLVKHPKATEWKRSVGVTVDRCCRPPSLPLLCVDLLLGNGVCVGQSSPKSLHVILSPPSTIHLFMHPFRWSLHCFSSSQIQLKGVKGLLLLVQMRSSLIGTIDKGG